MLDTILSVIESPVAIIVATAFATHLATRSSSRRERTDSLAAELHQRAYQLNIILKIATRLTKDGIATSSLATRLEEVRSEFTKAATPSRFRLDPVTIEHVNSFDMLATEVWVACICTPDESKPVGEHVNTLDNAAATQEGLFAALETSLKKYAY